MKINWIYNPTTREAQEKKRIELEYLIRPKLFRYLLEHFDQDCSGDFSSFSFNVHIESGKIEVAKETPLKYRENNFKNFEAFMNGERSKLDLVN
ncbi:hypothetical protein [Flavobacterium sp. ASW18X]|uniref:hypothetical protein n=1 Tax=Flavobacterium sp. ASW18X TaxID=2572595 RepID=UPI0010AE073F|nr:hypothetical protein [Flavobacterium sp. ASW18X]TKD61810.1 hypothetical protein FBT53_10540 [Flavobacterium sp. ASW18X]